MNSWGIPEWLEEEVRARDRACVYCRSKMIERVPRGGSRKLAATWEHIVNDARIVTRENIARCCSACNSSKGTKKLSEWMESDYCRRRGINKNTVADVVKAALRRRA
jgi:5-methylcytosine-specific restriction endonuclease McrA